MLNNTNELDSSTLSHFNSIVEIIERRAILSPDKIAFIFINSNGDENSLTYSELFNSAKKVASYLHAHGQKGDRVVLLFPQGLDFIKSFIACLLAGMIAVPAYPPKKNKKGVGLNRLIEDASPSVILSVSGTGFLSDITQPGVSLCEIDTIAESFNESFIPVNIAREDIAFLQYTSGSTGTPKGVMVSHGNIISNEHSIKDVFKMSSNDILVGWLPFYHDMGLIGNILQPLFTGFIAILMAPIDFLQSPFKWLSTISRFKATVSGGPNFAYALCLKSINTEELKKIDLSSWKVAFNGAEPINPQILRGFYDKFKECGFHFSSFYPCYGMAETTLLISGGSISQENAVRNFDLNDLQFKNYTEGNSQSGIKELVNCGKVNALDFKIVKENHQEQEVGKVGEIIVSGESVTKGYWNDKKKTAENFEVKLNGQKYFKTGDLGVCIDNHLYITGRLKDLIIINGRNYYPQDIEDSVSSSHECIITNSAVAFTISETKEKLVVIAEVKLDDHINKQEIIDSIIANLSIDLELAIDELVLVRRASLLKTTSGKIQRSACKEIFLNGSFNEIIRMSDLKKTHEFEEDQITYSDDEKEIVAKLSKELGYNIYIRRDQSFFNYGLDSISTVRLVSFINKRFKKDFLFDVVYEKDTLEKLLEHIYSSSPEPEGSTIISEQLQKASSLQTIMWLNQQKNIHSSAYNIPMFLNVKGVVNIEALRSALNNLVKNHKTLRSTFDLEGDKVQLKFKTLADLSINEYLVTNDLELEKKVKKISQQVFNLKTGPLFSLNVIQNQEGLSKILFLIHHIVVDGTSLVILVKELEERYNSLNEVGKDLLSISENSSFESFIASETRLINDKNTISKKEYWKAQLEDYNENIKLPVENTSFTLKREGASVYFSFDEELCSEIKKLSELTKTNLFSCLLAGYKVFLSKISGSKDLIIGTPVSLRTKEEYIKESGLFINTLMLRSKIAHDESFESLTSKVYSNSRNAIKNGSYPFGQILQDINVQSTQNQLALTSLFFNFLDFAQEESGKRLFDVYQSDLGIDINFDLNLYVLPDNNIIRFRLDYCKALFSQKGIDNLVSYFVAIVRKLLARPQELIVDIDHYINIHQNFDLVVSPVDYAPFNKIEDESIGSRFDKVADSFLDKTAIKGGKEYSYQEVKEISNGIASALKDKSKSKNIGLFMGHSEDMIFGMLGVLKTGLCYIPIDNTYPEARITFLLEDAKIDIIVTNNENYALITSLISKNGLAVMILNIEEISPVKEFNNLVSTDSIAYILYTSGSTGVPKGVVHDQNYIMHIASSFTDSLKISASDCISLIPSFSFSASMMDVFGALLNGASLKIIDIKKNGIHYILSAIKNSGITIYHSVPTIFRALIDEIRLTESVHLQTVRLVYLAGEPLLSKDITLFKQYFSKESILVNGLGCTEFNICSQNFITHASFPHSAITSVGYNGIGVEVLILDANGRETNGFAEGEIALRGNYLAKGYWNDDALTSQKFIQNENSRTFLTGDIGRRLPDGKLLHLGRQDFQIKILGQRVELGEIEAVLLNLPDIDNAVVTQKKVNDTEFICAHIISSQTISEDNIIEQLKSVLPHYMLPQRIVQVEKYPLTATGKIDRKNLPLPESSKILYIAPVSHIENKLVELWENILGKAPIGVNDSFFMIGGNSIKAIKLVNEINTHFEVNLSVSDIFTYTSVKALSHKIQSEEKVGFSLKPSLIKEFYDLTNAQIRIWIQSQLIPYNINIAFSITGALDVNALEKALTMVLERHEVLRTIFIEVNGSPKQKVNSPDQTKGFFRYVELQKFEDPVNTLKTIQSEEIYFQFDLETGPLFRTTIIKCSDNEFVLFNTIHHIIADGWSMEVFTKDLLYFYSLIIEGKDSVLTPVLKVQFRDYIEYEISNRDTDNFKSAQKYWLSKFANGIDQIVLPYDRPRSKKLSFDGGFYKSHLDSILSRELLTFSNKHNVSAFVTFIAALKVLFFKYSNQQNIILGTMSAGRERKEWHNQIGMYAKTLILKTNLSPEESFINFMNKVYKTQKEALQHDIYPIDQLAEDLNLTRDSSRTMFFNVLIVFHENTEIFAELKNQIGLDFKEIPKVETISKFDLTININKNEDEFVLKTEYNSTLFDEISIAIMIKRFYSLLENILANPIQNVGDMEMKSPLEKQLEDKKISIDFNF